MSAIYDDNNLPGVLVDIENEIVQEFDPSKWGTTDSVVLIGTAFSGPVAQPIKIYNSDMANYIFGASYNPETKKSATLTAAVRDAYDRGCTTIYAMRVGGTDIYKDFQFCDENNSDFRLRVVNRYPSNVTKDCYIFLDLTDGVEALYLYKPTSKATINESKSGLVGNSNTVMKSELSLASYGLTKSSKLTDLIELFNDNFGNHNNVLDLQIVNKKGIVVTNTPEAKSVAIGSCYPGLYMIGHDASNCISYTDISSNVVIDSENDPKPFQSYDGTMYKTLLFNTDVSAAYPIYANAETYAQMQDVLSLVEVASSSKWDFLETSGAVAKAWEKDPVDYEGTDMTKFEMYQALGSGFATTAMVINRGKKADGTERKPRVSETPVTESDRVVGITDGIYNLLQDAEIRYRVLTCANADDKINGALPKADAFKIAIPRTFYLLGEDGADNQYDDNLVVATANIDSEDFTSPKDYEFKFVTVDEDDVTVDNFNEILQNSICTVVAGIDMEDRDTNKAYALLRILNGDTIDIDSKVMVFDSDKREQGQLLRYKDKSTIQVLNSSGLEGQLYAVDNILYIGVIEDESVGVVFKPVAPTVNTESATSASGFARVDGTDAFEQYEYKNKDYILIESCDTVYVAAIDQKNSTADAVKLSPLGSLEVMLSENSESTLVYVENNPIGTNKVVVTVGAMDAMTLTDFVALMNEDAVLGNLFTFAMTAEGTKQADMYLDELSTGTGGEGSVAQNVFFYVTSDEQAAHDGKIFTTPEQDKYITYDYSKRIPYTTSDNFARQLAQHCAYTSLRTKDTHGFIGLSPTADTTIKAIATHVKSALANEFSLYAKAYNGINMLGSDKLPYRIGNRISVTAFQYDVVANDSDGYITKVNGAAGYAGMVSQLPITQSSTYQPISIAQGVDFQLTHSQNVGMVQKGYVTTTNSLTRGLTITDGVTMGEATDMTKRLMVIRILDRVSQLIRTASEPFLGKANTIANRNSLNTAIDAALTSVKGEIIESYEFTIQNLSTYTSDSRINISYVILPANEIREIYNSISVIRNG